MYLTIDWRSNYICEPDGTEKNETIDDLNFISTRDPPEDSGIAGVYNVLPPDDYDENNRTDWIRILNYLHKMLFINGRKY